MFWELDENTKYAGAFGLTGSEQLYGELTLAGPKTLLYVRSEEPFPIPTAHGGTITGETHSLVKVTLVDCLAPAGLGSASIDKRSYHYAKVFPHYVLTGQRHIDPSARSIFEISFKVDDAFTLFYDHTAFGRVRDTEKYISEIVEDDIAPRRAEIGEHPQIVYFTGKDIIFSADTEIGTVSAHHCPNIDFGSPKGIGIENNILIRLCSSQGFTFSEAIYNVTALRNILGLLVGRGQNLESVNVRVQGEDEDLPYLHVYSSTMESVERRSEWREPHPAGILVDAIEDTDSFSRLITNWIARQPAWRDARWRYFTSFADPQNYDIDRLIRAANMFDILPSEAIPESVAVADGMQSAVAEARRSFRKLPRTPERDSVLNTLGRVGKPNLKRKVRFRAKVILDELGGGFDGLCEVTDEAVNCRNHYVHGTDSPIDYNRELGTRFFLTDTLEFVFAASDLVEAGWDIGKWIRERPGQFHPFGMYRLGYQENRKKLESLL